MAAVPSNICPALFLGGSVMLKKLAVLMVLLLVLLNALIPISAAEEPVIYQRTITVTNDGGVYQVGFATLEFKKDFIQGQLPIELNVSIYAENGELYVDVSPSEACLDKQVHVRIDSYKGLLYDKALGENISVSVKKQQLLLQHFSRHAFS